MAFLSNNYLMLPFSEVVDINDFMKSKLPEMNQVKGLYDNIKLLFNLPGSNIALFCSEGERIYKYMVLAQDLYKTPLGWFYYIPAQKRLDLYSPDSPSIPILQWKNKKPVFKNYLSIFDRVGLDKLFSKLVNIVG